MTFTENLQLVRDAVDHSASNSVASPVQQFWSLSIQVQVLVLTPVVLAAGAAVLRAAGRLHHARRTVVVCVALGTATSFVWSLVATAADQQVAYFSTLPRVWELGTGALVALLLAGVRPGPRTATALGWGGVAALVACGAVLDGAHEFPGWQAAWPVLCTVAVLVAAYHGGRLGAHRALGAVPMRWLGARSSALYLWHRPVLVLYLVHSGREAPSVRGAVAVVALSLVLAALTHRLVEQPAADRLRTWRPVGALAVVVLAALPLLAAGRLTLTWLDGETARVTAAADDPAYPGAAAPSSSLVGTGGVEGGEPLPPMSVIRDDWPHLPDSTCRARTGSSGGPPRPRCACSDRTTGRAGSSSSATRTSPTGCRRWPRWPGPTRGRSCRWCAAAATCPPSRSSSRRAGPSTGGARRGARPSSTGSCPWSPISSSRSGRGPASARARSSSHRASWPPGSSCRTRDCAWSPCGTAPGTSTTSRTAWQGAATRRRPARCRARRCAPRTCWRPACASWTRVRTPARTPRAPH